LLPAHPPAALILVTFACLWIESLVTLPLDLWGVLFLL